MDILTSWFVFVFPKQAQSTLAYLIGSFATHNSILQLLHLTLERSTLGALYKFLTSTAVSGCFLWLGFPATIDMPMMLQWTVLLFLQASIATTFNSSKEVGLLGLLFEYQVLYFFFKLLLLKLPL